MFRTYSVCVISVYTYIHRHSNRPARQLGRSRAGVTRRRARRPDGMRDGEDASRARSGRPCALCSTTKRNPRPKKVLKKCYDALDADVVLGPLLLDDRGGARGPVYCHQACALWCPEVYFDARTEKLRKLAEALRRARRIPCARCKGKGAAIGCAVEACPRSYHFACAHADGCAFVQGEFMLACPRHARRMASERADARWQDAGVEDAVEEGQGKGAGSGDGDGSNDRGVSGARDGSNGATAPVEAPPLAAPGATPILNRIRATAEISRGRKQKKRKRVKLADDKFMNTREGAIYRAVMEAGVRLNAEKEKSTGAIADDDEAFRLRESRRLDKDKELIPRVVIGGGLGTSTYSAGWESLAGMEEHVKTLKELTLLPLAYPEMFESLGAGAARGVLLHGPPGTGKTAAVRAMLGAAARGPRPISFFSRLGADCLGKYSGEAERKLRLLFEEAEKRQPSIIFFDEIDGLAPARRGGGGSGAQDEIHSSVVATLLALMDGLSGRGSVVVVASTNRPDAVDPALRRPGRFDRELFFGLPDAEARADILAVHTRAWTPRPSRETLEAVASRTEGCAGADLRAVANAALMSALKRTCPSLLSGDPTRDSLAVELEARLPPPESSKTALEEARVAHESGHAGAFLALKQFDALAMRVKVYWPLEDAHHEATIVGYDRNTVSHRLRYDDSNLFNGEDVWMQLFRPNVGLEVVPSDLEKHPVKATVRTRVRESLEDANDLLEKYRNSRRDGVSVSSRDWTHALSTTSNACSARSAAAALVPRGKPLESFLVPILGGSVRKVMSECFKRGAPMTPKCLSAASACADADVADTVVEDALIAAGAFERGSASIEDRDIVPLTHPSASGDDNSVRSGCRLLLAGESDCGQREIVDVVLNSLSGTSTHLINLASLISHGDGDAVRGVAAALLEPLRQATRTKTTLVMPDLDLWALAASTDGSGDVIGVTTTALWDLVQSTIADCYAAPSAGDGGLYVVSFVNLPTETLPEAVLHFFECDGAAMDVEPQFSEDRVKECVERAVYEIATVDVASAYAEARHHAYAKRIASRRAPKTPSPAVVADEETANEAACEALRIRVRRARAIVRAAIAKCVKELLKTHRFDRFFNRSEQAGKLIQLALDRKIGNPNRFVKDLRACARALKPRRVTHANMHKPIASLGFSAVDTLESWFHLGVAKLYDEYVATDAEYDEALASLAKVSGFSSSTTHAARSEVSAPSTIRPPTPSSDVVAPPRLPPRPLDVVVDDVRAALARALPASSADVSLTLPALRRAVDATRLDARALERVCVAVNPR